MLSGKLGLVWKAREHLSFYKIIRGPIFSCKYEIKYVENNIFKTNSESKNIKTYPSCFFPLEPAVMEILYS